MQYTNPVNLVTATVPLTTSATYVEAVPAGGAASFIAIVAAADVWINIGSDAPDSTNSVRLPGGTVFTLPGVTQAVRMRNVSGSQSAYITYG